MGRKIKAACLFGIGAVLAATGVFIGIKILSMVTDKVKKNVLYRSKQ